MLAIKTVNLTKKYKDKNAMNSYKIAVDNLNLSIEKGEIFALLGVNGAGKTTTIKMLSCIITPTSGDADVLGESITYSPYKVKEKINVSPQETAVAPNLTVMENLELICGIYGHSKKESKEKTENIIKEFGLSEIAKTKAKILSGGWQRRLSIAMALITEPEVLFLDEPTLGLDVIARRELWKVIENLKGKVTIILTTHYLEEAQALSDHIAVMSDGKLRAVGTAKELMDKTSTDNFEDAFIQLCEKEGEC